MYATDFEYDGQYLSDYGFIICHFDYSTGADVADAGSKISFEKVSRNGGKKFSLTNAKYDECVTATFDICKNPDNYDYEEREITDDEYRDLMRWLNRKNFYKFQAINEDKTWEETTCYYDVSFNVEKIKIAEKLYGLRLTLESDRPFGYGQEIVTSWTFSNVSTSKNIYDMSDEIGYIYPNVEITCLQNGDLSIHNEFGDWTTLIKNCSTGEVITMQGNEQIISTTNNSHDICNDFNWEFLKIGNTFNDRNNIISVSRPCKIVIKYCPIIKCAL